MSKYDMLFNRDDPHRDEFDYVFCNLKTSLKLKDSNVGAYMRGWPRYFILEGRRVICVPREFEDLPDGIHVTLPFEQAMAARRKFELAGWPVPNALKVAG